MLYLSLRPGVSAVSGESGQYVSSFVTSFKRVWTETWATERRRVQLIAFSEWVRSFIPVSSVHFTVMLGVELGEEYILGSASERQSQPCVVPRESLQWLLVKDNAVFSIADGNIQSKRWGIFLRTSPEGRWGWAWGWPQQATPDLQTGIKEELLCAVSRALWSFR